MIPGLSPRRARSGRPKVPAAERLRYATRMYSDQQSGFLTPGDRSYTPAGMRRSKKYLGMLDTIGFGARPCWCKARRARPRQFCHAGCARATPRSLCAGLLRWPTTDVFAGPNLRKVGIVLGYQRDCASIIFFRDGQFAFIAAAWPLFGRARTLAAADGRARMASATLGSMRRICRRNDIPVLKSLGPALVGDPITWAATDTRAGTGTEGFQSLLRPAGRRGAGAGRNCPVPTVSARESA